MISWWRWVKDDIASQSGWSCLNIRKSSWRRKENPDTRGMGSKDKDWVFRLRVRAIREMIQYNATSQSPWRRSFSVAVGKTFPRQRYRSSSHLLLVLKGTWAKGLLPIMECIPSQSYAMNNKLCLNGSAQSCSSMMHSTAFRFPPFWTSSEDDLEFLFYLI